MASNEDIYGRIGSLEGTVTTFISELRAKQVREDADKAQMQRDIRDVDAKAQSVKDRQTWLMGVASGLSVAGGALSYVLSLLAHNYFRQPQV